MWSHVGLDIWVWVSISLVFKMLLPSCWEMLIGRIGGGSTKLEQSSLDASRVAGSLFLGDDRLASRLVLGLGNQGKDPQILGS